MVALSRAPPSTNARVMSSTELEQYFVTMLGVKRSSASTNCSHGGDVPQDQGTLHQSPDNWTFVGKTLPRPSSYEGSDAGYHKTRPHETSHAGHKHPDKTTLGTTKLLVNARQATR
jgi:hypothetical protein